MKRTAILLLITFIGLLHTNAQTWKAVRCGGEFTVAIQENGSLWGWGMNGNGQLGFDSESMHVTKAVKINEENDWAAVAAGGFHTLAIKTDGTLWGCGLNGNGQTGIGDNGSLGYNRYEFEQVGTDSDWVCVEACYASSFAIKKDRTLWAWGYNEYGLLGTGNTENSLFSPTQVGTNAHWTKVAPGGYMTAGIDTNGFLYLWGLVFDGTGYLILDEPIRMTVADDSTATFTDVSAGWDFLICLRSDSTLWALGSNYYQCLGEWTDSLYSNEWVQVSKAHNWTSIHCGSICAYATNDKGETYAWGGNLFNQLGVETDGQSTSVLTQITDAENCKDIQAAKSYLYGSSIYGFHTFLLKTDGSLCHMGSNYVCQLGTGEANNDGHTIECEKDFINEVPTHPSSVHLYPNPCQERLTVSGLTESAKEIVLTDMTGRILQRIPVTDSEIQIPMQGLNDGIYFIQVNNTSAIYTEKFIKCGH